MAATGDGDDAHGTERARVNLTGVVPTETVTLERAIAQQINLGLKDPHQIADLLVDQLGAELILLVEPHIADFISELARRQLNSERRRSVAKINKDSIGDPTLMLRSMWVPSKATLIYKRIADMTAKDFDARAAYLENMGNAILRHAEWCRDVASAMRAANADVAAKLTKLPPLRDEAAYE